MNKKVLSAILFSALFAGTGTFTSCIDNDEPAGIEELRGAKAELLRAQAAMQLADEAFRMAEVANQELKNEAQRIANQAAEIANQIAALDLAIKEAESEAEIAKHLYDKQVAELKMAHFAEEHKAKMLTAEAKTIEAQTKLDQAIAAAEAAKLTLGEDAQALLDNALAEMNSKKNAMIVAHGDVLNKQMTLNKQLLGEAKAISLSKLENDLLVAQNNMKVQELNVADAEKMLELAKNFDEETWSIQLDTLRADSLEAAQNKAAAQVNLDALYMGAEYQAAEKAFQKAVETLGDSTFTAGEWVEASGDVAAHYQKGKINDTDFDGDLIPNTNDSTLAAKLQTAAADSAAAVYGSAEVEGIDDREAYKYDAKNNKTTDFKLEAYESDPVDESLKLFLAKVPSLIKENSGYSEGVFSYKYEDAYTEAAYREDSADYKKAVAEETLDEYQAKSSAMQALMTVEGWVNALNAFKADTNGIAWTQTALDLARKDSTEKQEAFDEAKAKWQILVDAVNGKKATAPADSVWTEENGEENHTIDLEGAVAVYNDSVASLKALVANYNNAIDSLKKYENSIYDAAEAASKATQEDLKKAELYFEFAVGEGWIDSDNQEAWNELDEDERTLAEVKKLFSETKYDDCEEGIEEEYEGWLDDEKESIGEVAAEAATAALVEAYKDGGVLDSLASVLSAAETALNANTIDAEAVETVYSAYKTFLASEYGQLITAKNLTKYEISAGDSAEIGEVSYIAENGNIQWNDVIVKDFGGVAEKINLKKTSVETEDSVYASIYYDETEYQYYTVTGSEISDEILANLSVTEIDLATAVTSLIKKSDDVFGSEFDWDELAEIEQSRLVEVTEEMVKAAMEAAGDTKDYDDYGFLGALMKAKAEVAKILAYKDADKLVEPLLETLTAQFDALKAEIAANSAIVAAVEKKAQDAWLAYEAGKDAIEKALADRDALSAEAEAEVKLYEAIIAEKAAVLQSAEQQLEALLKVTVTGSLTPEKLIALWETNVANAQAAVETKKLLVAEAEKAIELYKAGEYNQAYQLAQCQLELEAAQASYEAAVKLYEMAVAEFNAILEALAK